MLDETKVYYWHKRIQVNEEEVLLLGDSASVLSYYPDVVVFVVCVFAVCCV